MPDLTVDKTREQRIDEFVLRFALQLVIDHQGLWCADMLETAVGDIAKKTQDIASELDPLMGELWPNDEDVETQEFKMASTRATAAASAMFTYLTTAEAQDSMRSEAARLAALAAQDLREVMAVNA